MGLYDTIDGAWQTKWHKDDDSFDGYHLCVMNSFQSGSKAPAEVPDGDYWCISIDGPPYQERAMSVHRGKVYAPRAYDMPSEVYEAVKTINDWKPAGKWNQRIQRKAMKHLWRTTIYGWRPRE